MTRFGFFLFTGLLLFFIYGLIHLNGSRAADISYMLRNFVTPYVTLILIMLLLASIRWFMSHDPEIAREIVTWANTLWLVPAITVLALYLMGAINGSFWHSLHGLMTVR